MPHVLVAGKLHPSGIELLKCAGTMTFDYVEDVSEASYLPFLKAADALVIRTQPLKAPAIAQAAKLKIVSRHGVGFDAVDVGALNARGIPLAIVGDVNSVSVAEHALMLMLAAMKRLARADHAMRSGNWAYRNRLESRDLNGKSLLILGYGRVGRRLACLAAAIGMTVKAYDPNLAGADWPDGPARRAENLDIALEAADVVSINMPKPEQPLLTARELSLMKPGTVIVNTARGGIIEEGALIEALQEGRLAAAGLDVFDEEPLRDGHPLLALDQVVLTPHIAGLSQECAERMALFAVQNVLDFFSGQLDPSLVVNGGRIALA